jgi:hypothetical protein
LAWRPALGLGLGAVRHRRSGSTIDSQLINPSKALKHSTRRPAHISTQRARWHLALSAQRTQRPAPASALSAQHSARSASASAWHSASAAPASALSTQRALPRSTRCLYDCCASSAGGSSSLLLAFTVLCY